MAKQTPEEFKAELRQVYLAKRDAMPPAARAAAAEAIAARPFAYELRPGLVISGYSPMQSELNPLPLMRKLADGGATLALPVVASRGKPLVMREWAFGQTLTPGNWGIREPGPDAPEAWPDILLVPLAAFDRKGNRIGYGAGYYDLTINRLRVLKPVVAIGLAYHAQHAAVVPFTPRDARLDLVLTERELIECGRK